MTRHAETSRGQVLRHSRWAAPQIFSSGMCPSRACDAKTRGRTMSAPQPWYLTKRAEALAVVHLTRRDDLRVERNVFDHGPELLVSIIRDGVLTGRQFGVALKARVSGARPPRMDKPSLHRARERYRDVPFPVCLFLFFMEDDAGFFRWIVEPEVHAGEARLERDTQLSFDPLTDAALGRIVDGVNAWYDARG